MNKSNLMDYEVIITKNDKINEKFFLLALSRPANFYIDPGQFVNIKVEPDSIHPLLRRPFSIFYLDDFEIGILYQIKGEGTKILSTKKIGSRLKMIGPCGNSFPLDDEIIKNIDSLFLIAGGIGIAPLFYYSKKIKEKYEELDIILLYGMKDESFLFPDDFIKYNFSLSYFALENKIIDDENFYPGYKTKFFRGTVIDILNSDEFNSLLQKYKNPLFALCGPDLMLKAFIQWNKDKLYESYLSLESFMGCGFHACLGCAVARSNGGYLYLCEEGAVVYYKDIKL